MKYSKRYSRQELFAPIGSIGQKKLAKSRITIIGAGGLGSVIANSLARAGVGFVRIADNDKLDITNLQRQILYDEEDLQKNTCKIKIAADKLKKINSEVTVEALDIRVEKSNIGAIIEDADIVMDGTDNFETRFIINQACIQKGIPWIFGSVAASYGMVFNIMPKKSPCFNCLFGSLPENFEGQNSGNVGILNTAVNVIASIQATEALKYLTGNTDAMLKDLMVIDLWNFSIDLIAVDKRPAEKCAVCGR
jgi:molybdopterin-synthase adenylyltransferase